MIAVSIVEVSNDADSGVASPSAIPAPPVASANPAATALRLPGLIPMLSNMFAVASRPCPPNHPNSFCVPCPKKKLPTVSLSSKRPIFIVPPVS